MNKALIFAGAVSALALTSAPASAAPVPATTNATATARIYTPLTLTSVRDLDLGTIVLRFGLAINPNTGQVSITPSASESIPTIIDGIVTHVRTIKVGIDRPGFTLNPTSCAAQNASSTLASNLGQSASIATPFRIDNCKELSFKPSFTAKTNGKTSRKRGASLQVALRTPGRLGSEANIREVKVELPHQLPSELKTLQKACTQQQFAQGISHCPKGAFVGHATASTPILPVPLKGPAIFVSHGHEWPSLVLALKGYGVNIDLTGTTHISKKGITSTTFTSVPDEPVGSFTLTLPEGRNSALAANENLCKPTRTIHTTHKITIHHKGHSRIIKRHTTRRIPATLHMPTTFIAQNGITIHHNTTITVTGCRTARHRHRHGRPGRHAHGRHARRGRAPHARRRYG